MSDNAWGVQNTLCDFGRKPGQGWYAPDDEIACYESEALAATEADRLNDLNDGDTWQAKRFYTPEAQDV